ncbi:SIR2 family protein [Companilactobacillus farciminis]|uniref:SIR2 family protein n=1 Tax=Companilactobacillus farciminis TaxID=1612 RepID=UPI0023314242|nr:SIR2 family protein [Companilactobacillus farciminis]WCG35800.1 SIR2 family protein [Companilactobacillus farciminis]
MTRIVKLKTRGLEYEFSENAFTAFKNGSAITKDDENESINRDEFNAIIQEEVSQFIDNSFSNIVVLLGAGASVVSNSDGVINRKYGKTVAMIAQIVSDELFDGKYVLDNKKIDVQSLEELSELVKYQDNIYEADGSENLKSEFNLEDFLSKLLSYIKFVNDDKTKNSKNAIFDIIEKETNYEYNSDFFKHEALLNLLSKKIKNKNKLNIVTTNYDTLIEDAANQAGYTIFDGFSFSQLPVFDDDMFEWNLVKDVPYVETNEKIYKKHVFNLFKIHGSLTWELNGDKILRKDKNSVKEPIMIFPSSDKYMQSYQEPYFELFSRFQEILKKPNTLLITSGFSFADNHISRMILQAIIHNTSLYSLITDFNIEHGNDSNKNWEELNKKMENGFPIMFLQATLNNDLTNYLGVSRNDN